jgi:thiol-disulfide isomerase/thioredoxin
MAVRMSRKTWVVLAIVIIAIGAVVGITLSHNSSSPSDLTLPIITWNETTLSTLKGTPVLLNFWSIGCPACRSQLPYLEAVAQETVGEIKVIAVNMADNAANVQKFFGEYEPIMTVALDDNGEVFVNYCRDYKNAGYIPFTLFVDTEGIVQYTKIGAFPSEAALWNTVHDVFGTTAP